MAISKRITYLEIYTVVVHTLDSGIDVGQKINVGPGKFGKNNKCRALNKRAVSCPLADLSFGLPVLF